MKLTTPKRLFFLVCISFLVSCEKEVSFNLKEPEPTLCLNCIMEAGNRDSIVMYVSQIQSAADEQELRPVEDASIIFQKNGVVQENIINRGKGIFVLNQSPEPGAHYTIEVSSEGFKTIKAETRVPQVPTAQAWFKTDTIPDDEWAKGYYTQNRLEVALSDQPGKQNYWFIGAKVFRDPHGELYGEFRVSYVSDKLNFDSFNRYDRQNYWPPFTNFEYYGALRLSDESFQESTFSFSIDVARELFVISADEHFDKHYKSSIKHFLVYEYDTTPIFEPVQIYSNIENGFGIFGAIAISHFDFNNHFD
ncbi:DUF4249 domain-containing protein [Sunxiuqinia elliptica]|uniref:Uncharacterized protein DUF4249 n=1 Tax=Sunxiuqinia elliptica TaxID=655355 RepID=A0A4R6H5E5_9BACT|nr:DUF4249 domain-containing protein [Sunxiuqinia elliptica]TDO03370.1 uncharacterized protein DUF4249 [Sunxiuqinia elliptica]TDO59567.1 uncharacterized protein DUF4249 [Sunxiuqinia elliptica]